MKNRDPRVLRITQAAVIAALYVVLTMVFAPISFGPVQVRIAEALCILPMFTPAAIPGLFIGCLIANLIGGGIILDVIFGSLATLIGALGTWWIGTMIRQKPAAGAMKFALPVPPIIANTIIVPLVLYYGYEIRIPIPIQMLTVGIGEVLGCGVIGMVLFYALEKNSQKIFGTNAA